MVGSSHYVQLSYRWHNKRVTKAYMIKLNISHRRVFRAVVSIGQTEAVTSVIIFSWSQMQFNGVYNKECKSCVKICACTRIPGALGPQGVQGVLHWQCCSQQHPSLKHGDSEVFSPLLSLLSLSAVLSVWRVLAFSLPGEGSWLGF